MKNNKPAIIMLILLIIITLAGAALVVFVKQADQVSAQKEPSIDDILEASVDIQQITTNLKNDNFIRVSFKIQTDGKKAKKELEKREFQVKNIIIQELSEMNPEDIQGREGQTHLQEMLKNKINEYMQTGKIVQVYITESLLQ
jgi:flagellar protein FliL